MNMLDSTAAQGQAVAACQFNSALRTDAPGVNAGRQRNAARPQNHQPTPLGASPA
jgi:hypothetical protein